MNINKSLKYFLNKPITIKSISFMYLLFGVGMCTGSIIYYSVQLHPETASNLSVHFTLILSIISFVLAIYSERTSQYVTKLKEG